MRFKITLIIILSCIIANAQRLKTNDIITLSKELLTESVGVDLIQYFDFSKPNGSFYKLEKNRFGYEPTKSFEPNRALRKNWAEIWVHWNFNFPEIDGVRSGLWVKLNKNLELIEPIELDFIPTFVWENKPSDFIPIEKAKEIGEKNLTKTEFGTEQPKLTFDSQLKQYVYEIWNKKTQEIDSDGKKHGVLEIIKISALSGKVIEITNGYYGKIIIR